MRTTVVATVLAVSTGALVFAGCGGDGGGDTAATAVTTTTAETVVEPAGGLPDIGLEPDVALLVLGGADPVRLDVTACSIDADAQPEGQVPAELLSLTATGTTADGLAVHVDVGRFRSLGASPTVTDTITVVEGDPDDPERALVAQRFEVDGLVTDLRDPDADDPLLRISGSTVEGGGVFAPPGATTGLVEGRLRADCS